MNSADWLNIAAHIPTLVTNVEQLYPQSGNGPQKLAAVVSAITPLVPAEQLAAKMPAITGWIGALVSLYNLAGFFNHSQATQPAA